MKTIRCDLPYAEQIEVHLLGDLHTGDPLCDLREIRKRIEHIEKTDNAYCILGGDLMDSAIKAAIGDIYGASLQPMEQLRLCVELFKPMAEAGKIIAILPGNHEERIYKQDGIDTTALMATQLGAANKYANTSALVFIRFGKDTDPKRHGRPVLYTGYINHGSGGGKKPGAKVNRLNDLSDIVDADFYVHFHTHLPVVFRGSYFRVSGANSSVSQVDRIFLNGASALQYGGYGDRQAMQPTSKRSPVLHLSGTHREMWATL